ncbi:unnamed protein product [Amaranthus hypochondriacus]
MKRLYKMKMVKSYTFFMLTMICCSWKLSVQQQYETDCKRKCGNTKIPYPFGIWPNSYCYFDSNFSVECDSSSSPNKAYLKEFNLEIVELKPNSLGGVMIVKIPSISICQSNNNNNSTQEMYPMSQYNFTKSIFRFVDSFEYESKYLDEYDDYGLAAEYEYGISYTNVFVSVGCENGYGLMHDENGEIITGCTSVCKHSPPNITAVTNSSVLCYGYHCCQTNFHLFGEFGIKVSNKGTNGSCRSAFLISKKYLDAGTPLTASSGTLSVPVVLTWDYGFHPMSDFDQGSFYGILLVSGLAVGALLSTCGCCWGLRRLKTKRRREEHKLRKKYFNEKLDVQGCSNREATEKIKIFTLSELKRYTDNFNKNHVLGQGGQGTVYKGMLKDGKVVAVKRSKALDQIQWKSFINEIILLSQIKHRHVVKILGCCLEGNIPLVVYEYISNGTLSELLHSSSVDFIFTWEMRLRIAYEAAIAIDYLHVGFPTPIYHRDIKSSNILLDDKFRAKLSDFGISRVVGVDHSHLSTCVQGTFGYLDPEYFYSSQYTKKSDVYSFGVILIELLTREKPIRPLDDEEEEDRSLVEYFVSSMNESSLFNIVDPIVLEGGKQEDIIKFSSIAKSCLNPIRHERPTMKEVTMGLEGLWCLRSLSMNKISEATTKSSDQINDWRIGSSSTLFSEMGNASFRAITFDNIDLNNTSCSKEVEMRLLHTN